MKDYDKLQSQIDDLQAQIAFQDDTIAQLNDIVTNQDKIIRKMEQRFMLIGEKIQDMESQLPNKAFNPADELPPHF